MLTKELIRTRDELPNLAAKYGLHKFVEIGVDLATYSKIILDGSPSITLWAIDPWLSYPENPTNRTKSKEIAFTTLKPYKDRVKIVELKSAVAFSIVPNDMDLIYVDGAHDAISVTYDLHMWYTKLRSGGVLAGHDFDSVEVKEAVLYFVGFFKLQLSIIPEIGDSRKKDIRGCWAHPSYYIVKP